MVELMHWFTMGGYSCYVWPAYGLVFVVLIGYLFSVRCQAARIRKKLLQWFHS